MLLMELLFRKLNVDNGNILEKYTETFKDFKTYTVKREFLKEIKDFGTEYFGKSINDTNGGLRATIYLGTLEQLEKKLTETAIE